MQNLLTFTPLWHLVDARGQPVGRVAVRIAHLLMGKHKPIYHPAGTFSSVRFHMAVRRRATALSCSYVYTNIYEHFLLVYLKELAWNKYFKQPVDKMQPSCLRYKML